jgi:hypothetical protein
MFKRLLPASILIFATLPGTANYQLNSYGFGSGGTANSTTSNYALEGTAGEVSGGSGSTANYKLKPGFVSTQQAHVPKLSSLSNGSGSYYNKLHFVIDTQGNPSDALYAIQISTDNFASDIRYVKSDTTLGSSLTLSDYKTLAGWGGASGTDMIGLLAATTYQARAKATQGKFTESEYGPSSSAATVSPSITFSLTTSSQATPPFSISYSTLLAGTVTSSSQTVNVALDTNAANGANVYITGKNNGLLSGSTGYRISSVSNNLGNLSEGYGAQNISVSQTNGGPFTVTSPYAVSGTNVGILDTTTRSLYTSVSPLTGGVATLSLLARASTAAIAASDYADILTLIAAGNF